MSTFRSYVNPDGSATTIISHPKIEVSESLITEFNNERKLIQAYADRGSIEGDEIIEEKLLPPYILQRARSRAELILRIDDIENASKKPKLVERLRKIIHH